MTPAQSLRRTLGTQIVRLGLRVALGPRGNYGAITFRTPSGQEEDANPEETNVPD